MSIYTTSIDEDIWFLKFQIMLLRMANTSFGRELMNIPKDFPKIFKIRKNCIHGYDGGSQCLAQFHVGAKFANIIRTRWGAFQSYSRYFSNNPAENRNLYSPLARIALSVYASTLTVSPDPNVETTTFDGEVGRDACGGTSWNALVTASSGNYDGCGILTDTFTQVQVYEFSNGGATNSCLRGLELYDTSSLTSSAVVSSAILRKYVDTASESHTTSLCLTLATTTSNTAIAYGDFGTQPDTGTHPPTEGITRVRVNTFTTAADNDITLNSTGLGWISLTGITKFGHRLSHDADNSAGTLNEALYWRSADTAGTSQDPRLIVTYTLPSAFLEQYTGYF